MEPNNAPQNMPNCLADDLLEGADAIAEFLFGSKESRRRVYYLAECSKLPLFRLGSVLCARRYVLLNFISGQENRVLLTQNTAAVRGDGLNCDGRLASGKNCEKYERNKCPHKLQNLSSGASE